MFGPNAFPRNQSFCVLAVSLILSGVFSSAAPPAWWSDGVPPIITSDSGNNKGPANVGQAKWMVSEALRALSMSAPAIASQIRSDLAGTAPNFTERILDLNIPPNPKPSGWADQQKAPLLIGQLKAISAPFYTRLNVYNPTWLAAERTTNGTNHPNSIFPWTATAADDANKAIATIGQLKAVFSLRFASLPSLILDADEDGLPDAWEVANGLDPDNVEDALIDSDNDGFNNFWEYLQNANPANFADRPKGMLVARDDHTLALTGDGRLWSWGANNSGELGDGTTLTRNAPVPINRVAGMGRIISVATGQNFSLALDEYGILWGWGSNTNRQISHEGIRSFTSPIRIHLPARIVRFACGNSHSLATDVHGRIWSWGSNGYGQLGTGDFQFVAGFAEVRKPTQMGFIVGLAGSVYTSHGVDSSGVVWSWGSGGYGQTGDGTYSSRLVPVAADPSTNMPAIRAISTDLFHMSASGADGSIWTWGLNSYGQLGSGNTSTSNRPFKVGSGLSFTGSVAAGGYHTVAVSQAGDVWTWGFNGKGQLGTSSTASSSVPIQTSNVTNWSSIFQVAAGNHHSAALKSDGSVWTWGQNHVGQLGHGDAIERHVPTRLLRLKLHTDDSDTDGLPDSWERFYFDSLTKSASTIHLANGITNLSAYSKGLSPLTFDNDNDGISDSLEIAAGLDPLDWTDATGDLDGDRIPNVWELFMLNYGAMLNAAITPSSGVLTVDAALKTADTTTQKRTITAAIHAIAGNSINPPWVIIRVHPGVYKENITLPSDKRILLIPASSSGVPEIQGVTSAATINVYGESVVDGFRINHTKGVSGSGVYSYVSSGKAIWRIVNCLIYGNSGAHSGAGVYAIYGRTVISHCSIFGNSATSQGNAISIGSSNPTVFINSICWNPSGAASQEVFSQSHVVSRKSIVRDGSVSGALLMNPLLNSQGLLKSDSPARFIGSLHAMAPRDIHGELRGSLPDIGADHFVDSDGDGLPNWLESLGVVSASADRDADGLSNLVEYQTHGTDTFLADTDGDGLNDGVEVSVGTNPLDSDSDSDEMRDGWEHQYGLNPLSDLDALEDLDRDRIPNLFESANRSLPNNAASIPAIHITVDRATVTNTASQKATIMAAVTEVFNQGRHTVIRVKPGIYQESVSFNAHRVLLLGDLGPNPAVLQPVSGNALGFYKGNSAVDGIHLRPGPTNSSSAIHVQLDLPKDQIRIVNSKVTNFSAFQASAGNIMTGRLTVAHCTVMDNASQISCHAFQVYGSGRLTLQNSIVWNSGSSSLSQILQSSPGIATAAGSIILGGELGAASVAPGMDRYHGLMPGSPALGAGVSLPVSALDLQGELRPALTPDIGADQRRDSDTDGLPDWWELINFGNLTRNGSGDHDAPQGDRLSNFYEYLLGFSPVLPISPGSNLSDLHTAVFERQSDPWYPQEWWLDPDDDGLTDNFELFCQTSPIISDTNGDGISDWFAFLAGVSPISSDTDGDGVSNANESINGTNPRITDSDGDGVNDNLDPLPNDPDVWSLPSLSGPDTLPPVITLIEPIGAVFVP